MLIVLLAITWPLVAAFACGSTGAGRCPPCGSGKQCCENPVSEEHLGDGAIQLHYLPALCASVDAIPGPAKLEDGAVVRCDLGPL